jgi:hypothetical protein
MIGRYPRSDRSDCLNADVLESREGREVDRRCFSWVNIYSPGVLCVVRSLMVGNSELVLEVLDLTDRTGAATSRIYAHKDVALDI